MAILQLNGSKRCSEGGFLVGFEFQVVCRTVQIVDYNMHAEDRSNDESFFPFQGKNDKSFLKPASCICKEKSKMTRHFILLVTSRFHQTTCHFSKPRFSKKKMIFSNFFQKNYKWILINLDFFMKI